MEWTIGWWQISIQRVWPTKDRLTRIYNKAAPRWHRNLHLLGYDRAYTKLFQSLQQSGSLAHLKDDSTICDCGIGTAAFSLALAKTVTPKIKIIGMDISDEMLLKARQILSQAGVNHQVCQGDAIALPFEDNTFDLVMSAHMLEHLPNATAGLSEMVRVLRSGTPLLLAVTRPGLIGSLIQFYWGNGCLRSESLTQMMADAGLTNIRVYPFTHGLSRWMSIVCLGFKK